MPGILNARVAQEKFRFASTPPASALASHVAHYWQVTWDLRGQEPHVQDVLPYPSVNMTFKPGRCRVAGVPRGRFSEVLEGAGRVFGVRFQPGGFRGFLGAPVSSITDRFLPVEAVFGDCGLAEAVLAADDAVPVMEAFLSARVGAPDPAAELATRIVARAATDPSLTRAEHLAAAFDLGMRRLQRLFSEYVGVGPKWVIRRYRLHEAVARTTDSDLDLVQLAADLGYSDQAHLTRDFTALVGAPPARYARSQLSEIQ